MEPNPPCYDAKVLLATMHWQTAVFSTFMMVGGQNINPNVFDSRRHVFLKLLVAVFSDTTSFTRQNYTSDIAAVMLQSSTSLVLGMRLPSTEGTVLDLNQDRFRLNTGIGMSLLCNTSLVREPKFPYAGFSLLCSTSSVLEAAFP